jgi:hypothetical protein
MELHNLLTSVRFQDIFSCFGDAYIPKLLSISQKTLIQQRFHNEEAKTFELYVCTFRCQFSASEHTISIPSSVLEFRPYRKLYEQFESENHDAKISTCKSYKDFIVKCKEEKNFVYPADCLKNVKEGKEIRNKIKK